MYNKFLLPILGTILLYTNVAIAQDNNWSPGRPDGHAPISVMGDHYHKKGELMFSYRYMPMWMDGSLKLSDKVSNADVHKEYMVAPQKMLMNMHMLGVMYALSDNLTLMAMGNYITNSMDLKTRNGVDFTTESGGISDVTLAGLIKIMNSNGQSLHSNVTITIPIGDINQRDVTPMSNGAEIQLAYPMQLGGGTWDPTLGLTYLGQSDMISWGAQSKYKLRLGKNSKDYTLGNRFDALGWVAIKTADFLSFSASLNYFNTQKIDGIDKDLNPMMMPLFNTINSGRSQLDIGIGTNIYIPEGGFKNIRIGTEIKFPVFCQKVNGIQMNNSLMAVFGIQYSL